MGRKSEFIQDNISDTFKEIRCLMDIFIAIQQEIINFICRLIKEEVNTFKNKNEKL